MKGEGGCPLGGGGGGAESGALKCREGEVERGEDGRRNCAFSLPRLFLAEKKSDTSSFILGLLAKSVALCRTLLPQPP